MIKLIVKNEFCFEGPGNFNDLNVQFVIFICGKCGCELKVGECIDCALKSFKDELWWLDDDNNTYCPDCADEIREEEGIADDIDMEADYEIEEVRRVNNE